jgi:hypothetical protein
MCRCDQGGVCECQDGLPIVDLINEKCQDISVIDAHGSNQFLASQSRREHFGKVVALDDMREHKIHHMVEAGYAYDGTINPRSISQKLKQPDDMRREIIADDSAYFHARSIFT